MLRCSGSEEVEEPEQTQQTNIFQTGWKVNFTIFQNSNRETDHLEYSLHCAYNLKANPNALRCVGELSRIWTARLPGAITTGRGATTTECGIECMLESFDTSWCDDRASALLLKWEMACHFRQELLGVLVRVEDGALFRRWLLVSCIGGRWRVIFVKNSLLYTRTPWLPLQCCATCHVALVAAGQHFEGSWGRREHGQETAHGISSTALKMGMGWSSRRQIPDMCQHLWSCCCAQFFSRGW